MERYIHKLQTFVNIGRLLANLSTCKRKKVSAVIFPTDCSRIYAIGYNGPSRGLPNDACTDAEGKCGCVHAEANALIKFDDGVARPSIMYVSIEPCQQCASMILNCNSVVGILFDEQYRERVGVDTIARAKRIDVLSTNSLQLDAARRILERWKSMS